MTDRTEDRPGERPVDWERDRRARGTYAVFLAGPVIWFLHFMVVYVVVEVGCTGGGEGLRAFAPPVPKVVTLAATAVAGLACLAATWWALRRWRPAAEIDEGGGVDPELPGRPLAFAGFLLSALSFVAVLSVGLPALYLPAC